MPLINTLRADDNILQQHDGESKAKTGAEQTEGEKDDENDKKNTRKMETIPNPPSFYDDDMRKWNEKFGKHIKEREAEKKH